VGKSIKNLEVTIKELEINCKNKNIIDWYRVFMNLRMVTSIELP